MDEIRFKFLSDSVLKAFEKDGRKYCRLTASSNAEDLVGDVMSQKALEQMKSAAVGTASPFAIFDFGFAIGRSSRGVGEPGNPNSEIGNPKWLDDRIGHEARSHPIFDLQFRICDWPLHLGLGVADFGLDEGQCALAVRKIRNLKTPGVELGQVCQHICRSGRVALRPPDSANAQAKQRTGADR